MMMSSMFGNPNLFGGYLILIFPFSILYTIHKLFFKRIFLSILAMLSIVSLILSGSQNSWIAFAMLLIFIGIFFSIYCIKEKSYGFLGKILNWKWICVFVICCVIIFCSFYIYLKKGKVLELLSGNLNWHIPIEQKLDIRLPLWKQTIQIVEDFPLWGVGIGEFNFALQKYSYGFKWAKDTIFHAHNYFLQITVELGLTGLYAFLWILGIIFIKGFQIVREKHDFLKLGLWFGIIGFVLTFFGDGYLWNIEMQLMFWLFIGLLFVDEEESEMAQTHRKPINEKLFIGLSIIVLLTIPVQVYQRSRFSFLPEKIVGLYKEVFNEEGEEYRWGEKVVLIPLEIMGKAVHIPIKLGNPDIRENSVKVKIFISRKMVDTLDFKDNDWHILRYPIEHAENNEIFLKIEASRTWNPYLTDGRLYPWDLGPAIGKIYWSS
jgi:hypothetical protein